MAPILSLVSLHKTFLDMWGMWESQLIYNPEVATIKHRNRGQAPSPNSGLRLIHAGNVHLTPPRCLHPLAVDSGRLWRPHNLIFMCGKASSDWIKYEVCLHINELMLLQTDMNIKFICLYKRMSERYIPICACISYTYLVSSAQTAWCATLVGSCCRLSASDHCCVFYAL